MWKKTLGLAVLAFVLSLTLQSCSSRYRNGHRGYAPAYVEVRVGTRHSHGGFVRGRSHGPSYGVRRYDDYRHQGRHFRNFKHKHYRGCGHR
jgi:hypothetical protein